MATITKKQTEAIELARKQIPDNIETRAVYCWERETEGTAQ